MKERLLSCFSLSRMVTGRLLLIGLFLMTLGISAMAQQKIQLHPTYSAKSEKSDMTGLQTTFSFSVLEAQDSKSEEGEFSLLSMPNTVMGGNEGEPEIPVVNKLIAVPVDATPHIKVKGFHTEDYSLDDYNIKTIMPRQPSLRKDKKVEDVPFVYDKDAYEKGELRSEPRAVVEVLGTMRGVRIAKMTIEPVSYDPVKNAVRVFNDIEVEVNFDGANIKATEDLYTETYSPYFDIVYRQLFNGSAVKSAYDDHPDLYATPVKMLVVTTQAFADCAAFQEWVTWKKQKGFYVDVRIVADGADAKEIRRLIISRYNTNHPTFLVIVGDETVVTNCRLWDYDSSYGKAASDLEYASVDGDVYHDMFMSRMPVSNTTELGNLVNKILTYEKYTMSDPSYLNETLLIAGWDDSWTRKVGGPTIQYANYYYFNSDYGITPHVFITTRGGQRACYDYINNVGFVNYTAHGDIQEWYDPKLTNSHVNSLTNSDKYFWAMGNCCLTASFKNEDNNLTCFGEAMVRAANKGAFGYIGSVPESYWYEDYYFGVGATSVLSKMPTQEQTTTGAYDALFDDTGFNSLNAVPFIGNVAVTYAHANGYTSSVNDEYYWRAYQCFGDGSVMPYLKEPAANNVSHDDVILEGVTSFTVNADGGSYVSITVNNKIIGVATVPADATSVDVPFTTTPVKGATAMIVVTRNQRQPYINNNVPVIVNNAPQYTISTTVNPTEGGVVTGAGTYYESTKCTLTATANHGYAFDKWQNSNTKNPLTITVRRDAVFTAFFRQLEEHHITYNAQQTNGTVSVSHEKAYVGDEVTLTAHPDAGYMLDYWTVTTVSNEVIPVVDNKFIMPDSEVIISATFKTAPVDLTVFDGTDTNQYIPMYGYYFDDYTKSECIIPASELTAMVGSTITAITFYPSSVSSGSWSGSKQTVFLKEVSSTTLGGSYSGMSGATIVKVGAPLDTPTAGKAYTITFDTPYVYNGGNLLIGVYNDDDGSYNQVKWYGTSKLTSGVSAYGYNSDDLSSVGYKVQSFLPKTTFTYDVDNLILNLELADDDSEKPADEKNAALLSTYNGQKANVTLQGRTLWKDGDWNTLCLPFEVSTTSGILAGDGVEAMTLNTTTSNVTAGTLTLNFDAVGKDLQSPTIPAGTPFIIKWSPEGTYVAYDPTLNNAATCTDLVNPVFSGVTIVGAGVKGDSQSPVPALFTGGQFVGSYSPVSFTANDKSKLFLGIDNSLYWPNANMTVNAFRAYFQLDDTNSPVREFRLNFKDETKSQGIISLSKESRSQGDGAWYDLQGRRVSNVETNSSLFTIRSSLKKGIYLHKGRKVVIK